MTADGQTFFLQASIERSTPGPLREIVIVQNWFEEFKRLVPVV